MSISVMFPDVYYHGAKVATISVAEHNVYDLIDELHAIDEYADKDERISELETEVDRLEDQRAELQSEVSYLEDDVEAAYATINRLEEHITELEAELEKVSSHVG